MDAVDCTGRRVLVRVDFNVPLRTGDDGCIVVSDDTRIRSALPTIRSVCAQGGKAILMSHLGRPGGEVNDELRLEPVAEHLAGLLNEPVTYLHETLGPEVEAVVGEMNPGDVLLLENTRFLPGEKQNDPDIARRLARLGDLYIDDAFGSSHRAHASTEGVASLVRPAVAGKLMEKELTWLGSLLSNPSAPFYAIVGGAKVSDKIGVIEHLLESVDGILIGGAMSYTFLRAKGLSTGTSLVEEDRIDTARDVLSLYGDRIFLPIDHVVASEFCNEAESRIVPDGIPEGMMGLDIGPATIRLWSELIENARTLVWNGPMGVFEMPNFSAGTVAIAEALARATAAGASSVVGGGDSVAAITQAGLEDQVSHVSTGGGAMLEFLEGKTLPGVDVLSPAH